MMKTTFRKTLAFLVGAVAGVMVLGFAAGTASAQATLTMGGTVTGNCTVSVATSGVLTLDLTVDNSTPGVFVGTINERCNDPDGYRIAVRSQNATDDGSAQAHLDDATATVTDTLDYTIVYDFSGTPTDATLVSGIDADIVGIKAKTTGLGDDIDFGIKYDGTATFLSAATYTDDIIVTITAVP